MAGKSSGWANGILKLLFNGTAIANIADNAASSPLTNLYASLHTADPGPGGDQTTHEAAYTSYARVAVARSSGGWIITGNSMSPAADINFPAATGGSETETFWGIGTLASGAGVLLYSGALYPVIGVSSGITPKVKATSTLAEN